MVDMAARKPEFKVRVGRRIRARRLAAGWSQTGLARKLPGHIEGTTISRWELAKSWPAYANVLALAKVFGITEEQLISEDLPKPPATTRKRAHQHAR